MPMKDYLTFIVPFAILCICVVLSILKTSIHFQKASPTTTQRKGRFLKSHALPQQSSLSALQHKRLSERDIYTSYFAATERSVVSRAVRHISGDHVFRPASMKHIEYAKPGYTVEWAATKYGYEHIRNETQYLNPLCIPVRKKQPNAVDKYDQICFNTLRDAYFSSTGEAIDPKRKTIHQLGGGCCWQLWKHFHKRRLHFTGEKDGHLMTVHERRPILVLSQHHGQTYFHVINEVIARYLYSLPLIDAVPNMMVAITDSDVAKDMLTHLGLEKSRIIDSGTKTHLRWYRSTLLIYPPAAFQQRKLLKVPKLAEATAKIIQQLSLEYVRSDGDDKMFHRIVSGSKTIERARKGQPRPKIRVLFIQRAKQRDKFGNCKEQRCLRNLDDFLSGLRRQLSSLQDKYMHKVEIQMGLFMPKENIVSTVTKFSMADVVVGLHGAGFQNMMFCRPNRTIIEIGFDRFYAPVAKKFKQTYWSIVAHGLKRESVNFEVDVDRVTKQVKEIIEQAGILYGHTP